jgi:methionyl-tRNA synthetase
MLGFDGKVEDYGWEWQQLPPGQKLQSPQPLFTKLDEKVVDEEYSRLRTTE